MADTIWRDADSVLVAIDVVLRHLADEWIEPTCREEDDAVMGCASCAAVETERRLKMLRREIEDEQSRHAALSAPIPTPP